MKKNGIDYEAVLARIYLMCKDMHEFFNDVSLNSSDYYAGNASAYKSIYQFIDKTEEYMNNICDRDLRK